MPALKTPLTDVSRLACPHDGGVLEEASSDALRCSVCERIYEVSDGIVRLAKRDNFYEGAYRNLIRYIPSSERLPFVLPLKLVHNGYLWQVRQNVAPGSTVVEFGCAGGVAYFGQRYHMIGLDVSASSLKMAAHLYDTCLMADALGRLPLQDGSVDAVVSAYFWEHMPPERKPQILNECYRVLRPGGKVVFLYDVWTENPLVRRARAADPERYQREFLDHDGHFGYETIKQNEHAFEASGLRVIGRVAMERTWLQSGSVYEKLRRWPSPLVSKVSGALYGFSTTAGYHVLNAAVRTVDETLGRLRPEKQARILLTVAQKTL